LGVPHDQFPMTVHHDLPIRHPHPASRASTSMASSLKVLDGKMERAKMRPLVVAWERVGTQWSEDA
jgi:hypothetical protein